MEYTGCHHLGCVLNAAKFRDVKSAYPDRRHAAVHAGSAALTAAPPRHRHWSHRPALVGGGCCVQCACFQNLVLNLFAVFFFTTPTNLFLLQRRRVRVHHVLGGCSRRDRRRRVAAVHREGAGCTSCESRIKLWLYKLNPESSYGCTS